MARIVAKDLVGTMQSLGMAGSIAQACPGVLFGSKWLIWSYMSYSYVDQKERVISGLARTDSMASYGSLRHVVVVAWMLRLLLFASSWGTCVM